MMTRRRTMTTMMANTHSKQTLRQALCYMLLLRFVRHPHTNTMDVALAHRCSINEETEFLRC